MPRHFVEMFKLVCWKVHSKSGQACIETEQLLNKINMYYTGKYMRHWMARSS
jgi:hypothetical protein